MSYPATTGGLLARNAGLNLLGATIPLGAALIAIPLLVGSLGTERYGVFSIALITVGYFSLCDLGLSRALTQLVAKRLGEGARGDLGALAWTALAATTVLGISGSVVVMVLAPWLVRDVLQIPPELHQDSIRSFYWLALCLPFMISGDGFVGILSAHQRFDVINAINIPIATLGLFAPVLAFYYVPTLAAAVAALAGARILAWLAFAVICLRIFPFMRQVSRPIPPSQHHSCDSEDG